jgi:hypothetical protein
LSTGFFDFFKTFGLSRLIFIAKYLARNCISGSNS